MIWNAFSIVWWLYQAIMIESLLREFFLILCCYITELLQLIPFGNKNFIQINFGLNHRNSHNGAPRVN
jgi:hypothetical protein